MFENNNNKVARSRIKNITKSVPNYKLDDSRNMSDTLEIVEITDSSICIVSPEVENTTGESLQNTTKVKRQLSDTDLDERSAKKICTDIEEDKVVEELIVSR